MAIIKNLYFRLTKNQVFRFLLVGGFCALQNTFLLYLLTTVIGWHYAISTATVTILINSIGYCLNRRYTFKLQKRKNNFWQGLLKYQLVMLSSFLTVLLSMYILVEIVRIWYLYAHILISIAMAVYNFLMHRKWTFK